MSSKKTEAFPITLIYGVKSAFNIVSIIAPGRVEQERPARRKSR